MDADNLVPAVRVGPEWDDGFDDGWRGPGYDENGKALPPSRFWRRMLGVLIVAWFVAVLMAASSWAHAQEVDANVVTAIDVSSSIDSAATQVQLRGMAMALQSPDVLAAIRSGRHKRIGFAVFLWSDGGHPVVVPWRVIGSAEDAAAAAAQLTVSADLLKQATGIGLTDLSRAIEAGGRLLQMAPFPSRRAVLNIVSNGQDNVGDGPQQARDALVAAGVEINGVVIGGDAGLLAYFQAAVVGGPMAFVVPVAAPENLVGAMRRKFVREIAMR